MKLALNQARAVAKGTPEHWLGGRLAQAARAASSASSFPPHGAVPRNAVHSHRRKKPQAAPQKFDLGRRGRARGGQSLQCRGTLAVDNGRAPRIPGAEPVHRELQRLYFLH